MTTKKNAPAVEHLQTTGLTAEQLKEVAAGQGLEYVGAERATGSVGTSVTSVEKRRPAGGISSNG